MPKRYIFFTIGFFAAAFLVIGGIVYKQSSTSSQKTVAQNSQPSEEATLTEVEEIPLTPAPAQSSQDNGLSVNDGSSGPDLGQLSPGSNGSSKESAPSKQTKSPFDPSTYGQFEKYKDNTSALYSEAKAGDGAELKPGMKAAVLYKGWLTDGTMFDASKKNEKEEYVPFIFTLGEHQVIPGWEQAVAGMKVGGVRMLIVPPSVGYGNQGQGVIPPNAVLVFQVQLLEVQ